MTYEVSNGTSIPHASGHYDLLAKLKTFLQSNLPSGERWTSLRSVTTGTDYEEIWDAPGLSGSEHIYTGIKTYQNAGTGYYNFKINGWIGYVSSNSFETQPGGLGTPRGIPLWQNSIPYIFVGNGQRVIVVAFVNGLPMSFYMGKFLPYFTPAQFPYPLAIGAMLFDSANTLYSNTGIYSWWKDHTNFRFIDGTWKQPNHFPYYFGEDYRNTIDNSATSVGYYGAHPIILSDSSNVYGELDGIYFISGFNNVQGNILTVSGVDYYVINDVWRVGKQDYAAIRLQ